MMIYRFIGNESFTLSTLRNGQLWFSKVEDFNDPFEWIFRYCINPERDKDAIRQYVNETTISLPLEERNIRYQSYIENHLVLENYFNRAFERFYIKGVCCFTEKENLINVLMWSYYANSHKGISLGFDDKEIKLEHIENFKNGCCIFEPSLKRVVYGNHKRCINPFDKNRPNILDTNYMKSKDWEYEKEVRIVSPKFGLHSFSKTNLKEIIFGIKTPLSLKESILEIVKNDKEYSNVLIKSCVIASNELTMEVR